MSSAGVRSGERMVHQDYIARVRYSNALPPPPNPPKLLDIPNTGLASGQYTTPGFASRLAREQPLNIEADAELGMPLNLVGMPGVFDGDERSIQAPAQAPPVHPHDRPLLRPIAALGKPKVAEANVSFLRRTEYISSSTPKRPEGAHARVLLAKAHKPVRPAADAAADSPHAIKRKIDRGFQQAELDLKDPKRIKHPVKKHLKLVEAVPLLPDLDAFPDSGAYVTIKFLANPVPSSKKYDDRLLCGILRPIDRTPSEEALYEAALDAHVKDPANNPKPPNLMNYDFYLPSNAEAGRNFRRKFDLNDPDHDDDDLYTHHAGGTPHFQYTRVRAYETVQETELDHPTKYDDEIILAYSDHPTPADPDQCAVLYYPVMQRTAIRPQRTKNINRTTGLSQDGDEQIVDQLDITVCEPTDQMSSAMLKYQSKPLGWDRASEEPEEAQSPVPDGEEDAEGDMVANGEAPFAEAAATADADDGAVEDSSSPESVQRRRRDTETPDGRTSEEDRDAEGEEDDEQM